MKFKLVEAAESKVCCICKKPFDGYGNNAEPVCSGSCCDECNMKEVIPARLKMTDEKLMEDFESVGILTYRYYDEDADEWVESEAEITKEAGWYQVSWGGLDSYIECSSIDDCKNAVESYYDSDFEWLTSEVKEQEDVLDVSKLLSETVAELSRKYPNLKFSYDDDYEYNDEYRIDVDGDDISERASWYEGDLDNYTVDELVSELIEEWDLDNLGESLTTDKSLNEGNSVSGKIPPALDSFLQDIAQMYGTIDYGDIMDHDYTEDDIRKLNNLRRRFTTWAQYDEDDEEVKAKLNEIANKVAEILKKIDENINTADEEDNNKIDNEKKLTEAVSKAALIKWLKEHQFGELTPDEFDILVSNLWDAIERENEERKFYRMAYKSIDDVDVDQLIDASDNPVHDLGYKLRGWDDYDELDESLNEDMSIRAKLKALYPELNFGDEVTEGFDDDMDFDIEEDDDIRRMRTLYSGADFDAYDDEVVDYSDCEDDECWENDLISDDYADGM